MKSDLPVFIDFQDAQVGPVDYDIASFLYDTYNPLSELDRKKYLEYYLKEVIKN
jgi:aminoglycoside/choline kinase family phosphotransferase